MRVRALIVSVVLLAGTCYAGFIQSWFAASRPAAASPPAVDTNTIAYWPCETWTTNAAGEYETLSTVSTGTILRLYWMGAGYTRGILPGNDPHSGTGGIAIVNLDDSARGRWDIINSSLLNGAAGCTLEYWQKTPSNDTSTTGHRMHSNGTKQLGLLPADLGTNFYAYVNITSGGLRTGGSGMQTGVWTHVCFTYDSAAQLMAVYVGGVLIGARTENRGAIQMDANILWSIGRGNAQFDDIRVRNRALTSNEVWSAAHP